MGQSKFKGGPPGPSFGYVPARASLAYGPRSLHIYSEILYKITTR